MSLAAIADEATGAWRWRGVVPAALGQVDSDGNDISTPAPAPSLVGFETDVKIYSFNPVIFSTTSSIYMTTP
jgi:hypothetical protein